MVISEIFPNGFNSAAAPNENYRAHKREFSFKRLGLRLFRKVFNLKKYFFHEKVSDPWDEWLNSWVLFFSKK
jgi:hypothetical protein